MIIHSSITTSPRPSPHQTGPFAKQIYEAVNAVFMDAKLSGEVEMIGTERKVQ